MLLHHKLLEPKHIFIPNDKFDELLAAARDMGLDDMRIFPVWTATFINDPDIPDGPLFRLVYLDYVCTWTGFTDCRPKDEVPVLFKRQRFFKGSLLAITLQRRDREWSAWQ